MSVTKLKEQVEFFATNLVDAEELLESIVEEHKHRVTKKEIQRKDKKGEEYFVVKVTITFDTIKNLTFGYGGEE